MIQVRERVNRLDIHRSNIRCNAVLPGFIETPMVQSVPDKVKEKFKSLIPFGRMGQPEGKPFLCSIIKISWY